jgi:hypothetical protein
MLDPLERAMLAMDLFLAHHLSDRLVLCTSSHLVWYLCCAGPFQRRAPYGVSSPLASEWQGMRWLIGGERIASIQLVVGKESHRFACVLSVSFCRSLFMGGLPPKPPRPRCARFGVLVIVDYKKVASREGLIIVSLHEAAVSVSASASAS